MAGIVFIDGHVSSCSNWRRGTSRTGHTINAATSPLNREATMSSMHLEVRTKWHPAVSTVITLRPYGPALPENYKHAWPQM